MKKRTFLMCLAAVMCTLLISCTESTQTELIQEEDAGQVIKADCITHYYKSNGSAYITRQQHQFNSAQSFFRSTSSEPIGNVECILSEGLFTISGNTSESLPDLPHEQWNEQLATSVYYSFCAGAGLLDLSSMKPEEKVKIEGRWYQPLVPNRPGKIKVTLFKSLDTEVVELVRSENSAEEFMWLLRSYNYRYSKELENKIPRTIDVFDISQGVASKALMIRFDYKDIH